LSEERVQRRLAAILAADVAGYSRLMGVDEEGTLAALKAHRRELIDPAIAAHNGRIVKTTGDGALVEFASVVDAVRCAIEFQREMAERNAGVPGTKRIEFRVGVNVGDIIIDSGDIYGDGVNVAARLEALAEPGGICISRAARDQVRDRLDFALEDLGEQAVKNIARPVRVFRIRAGTGKNPANPETPAAPSPPHAFRRRRVAAYAGLALALAALIVAGAWSVPGLMGGGRPAATRSGHVFPVVAVLPFANESGDKAREYLADGMTDDLINGLGRFNSIRVIGRNAVLPYKTRPATQSEIASQLGATYVIQGSVRTAEHRVRIAAQMTDARDSTVLWTNRYDGEMSDIYHFQDTIAREIVGTLAARIANMEKVRVNEQRRPNDDAYDLVLRARALGHSTSRVANRRFRELIAKVIEMDPNYSVAHALMSDALYSQSIFGWTEFPGSTLNRGEFHARRAIALAPDQPDGYRALGRILGARGEHTQAQKELHRAIELNPSDASALAMWGVGESYGGHLKSGIEALELALKFDPTLDASFVFYLALDYYLERRHEDAISLAERGIARYPEFAMFNVAAAAAAGQLGRTSQAQRYSSEIRRRLPQLDLGTLGSRYDDPQVGAYINDGLARAGIGSGPRMSLPPR
jgi:adenylate cyclase